MTTTKISAPTGDCKSWRTALKIHPAALEYPRLSDDELAELGADIKARGLQMNVAAAYR